MGGGSIAGIDFGGGATRLKSYPSQPQLLLSQSGAGVAQLLYTPPKPLRRILTPTRLAQERLLIEPVASMLAYVNWGRNLRRERPAPETLVFPVPSHQTADWRRPMVLRKARHFMPSII